MLTVFKRRCRTEQIGQVTLYPQFFVRSLSAAETCVRNSADLQSILITSHISNLKQSTHLVISFSSIAHNYTSHSKFRRTEVFRSFGFFKALPL